MAMSKPPASAKPPPLSRWASELLALPKIAAAPFRYAIKTLPFGNDKPVLVIPGMLSGDRSTALLRNSLAEAGFDAHGWGAGWNSKVTPEILARVAQKIDDLTQRSGQPAILIGWSLGGLYARIVAQRHPQNVSLLITLGSPFSGDRRANNAWRLYEMLNDHSVDNSPFPEDFATKPPIRTIAVWSRKDGIISPQSACGTEGESDLQMELPYKHFELATSRGAVCRIIELIRSELSAAS